MPSLLSNAAENKSGENAAGKLLLAKVCCRNTIGKMLLENAVHKILGANVADKILLGKC